MSVSSETVLSVLVGGLISGIITWLVAEWYFRKQDVRAEEMFSITARFMESFAANRGNGAQVGFTRDAKGRITNASVTITMPHLESTAKLYPPTVTTSEPRTGHDG